MKRYMLFAGQNYYARGGCNDFVKSFDNREDAATQGKNICCSEYCEAHDLFQQDWWHVFDTEIEGMVAVEGFPKC